ncbi:hypothetical protein BC831DRAFT_485361 [Entophlyctis helioformis]|nr:hypothetical protein BC831DRAFT_485361 [Entophlyctis helioformis]
MRLSGEPATDGSQLVARRLLGHVKLGRKRKRKAASLACHDIAQKRDNRLLVKRTPQRPERLLLGVDGEHVGVAVRDIKVALELAAGLDGVDPHKRKRAVLALVKRELDVLDNRQRGVVGSHALGKRRLERRKRDHAHAWTVQTQGLQILLRLELWDGRVD